MRILSFILLVVLELACVATAISSPLSHRDGDQGVLVNLRIEGAVHTIFEGFVFTRGHNVTTQSGGTHRCDGTNNSTSGPTATSALDDASDMAHFTWDGTFDTNFDDFLIIRIANSTQTSSQFWGLLVNFQFTQVGGCQQQVQKGDQVLWAFDAFSKIHFLEITGPTTGHRNQPITITVIDGSSGQPIEGATVDGHLTNAQGQAALTFTDVGLQHLKAEKTDSIRSNTLEVLISE